MNLNNKITNDIKNDFRWGQWATIVWLIVIILTSITFTVLAAIILIILKTIIVELIINSTSYTELLNILKIKITSFNGNKPTILKEFQNIPNEYKQGFHYHYFYITFNIIIYLPYLISIWMVIKLSKNNKGNALGLRIKRIIKFKKVILLAFITAAIYVLSFIIAENIFGYKPPQSDVNTIKKLINIPLLYISFTLFAIIILGPIAEELLFRGFIYAGLLKNKAWVFFNIILSSSIWAILHSYSITTIVIIFFFGIILWLLRWWTKTIWCPIITHVFVNAAVSIQYLTLYFK